MSDTGSELDVVERMRRDWDARALENAKFYVNCGLWDQDDAQFDRSAPDILARIRRDYALLPPTPPDERRFLEIGCGIGRLMLSLAEDCGEIHGVDVSAEMIRLGRDRLSRTSNACFHRSFGSAMPQFESGSFDLVYSFAVFQHIPDRDIVIG
jgi:SAM-dependent methyltransferase